LKDLGTPSSAAQSKTSGVSQIRQVLKRHCQGALNRMSRGKKKSDHQLWVMNVIPAMSALSPFITRLPTQQGVPRPVEIAKRRHCRGARIR